MPVLRAAAASVLGLFVVLPLRAQTVQLPETVVIATTPSPILRPPSDGAGAPLPSSETQAPLQGTLPVVTDQFVPLALTKTSKLPVAPAKVNAPMSTALPTTLGRFRTTVRDVS